MDRSPVVVVLVLIVGLVLAASPAGATTMVRVEPASDTIAVGESFDANILATFGDPVLGWGIDLTLDETLVEILGLPVIGPEWDPAVGADGDGLAGLAFPAGVTGPDVLLATLTIRGLAPGVSPLQLGVTGGDLTEGFALDPTGFDDLVLTSGQVTVAAAAEPPMAWLVVLAACLPVVLRRRRGARPHRAPW